MVGSNLVVEENGDVTYNGHSMRVVQKKSGNGYVLNVDGKRIRVSTGQFVLMYTYFSVMFKHYSAEMEQENHSCA